MRQNSLMRQHQACDTASILRLRFQILISSLALLDCENLKL